MTDTIFRPNIDATTFTSVGGVQLVRAWKRLASDSVVGGWATCLASTDLARHDPARRPVTISFRSKAWLDGLENPREREALMMKRATWSPSKRTLYINEWYPIDASTLLHELTHSAVDLVGKNHEKMLGAYKVARGHGAKLVAKLGAEQELSHPSLAPVVAVFHAKTPEAREIAADALLAGGVPDLRCVAGRMRKEFSGSLADDQQYLTIAVLWYAAAEFGQKFPLPKQEIAAYRASSDPAFAKGIFETAVFAHLCGLGRTDVYRGYQRELGATALSPRDKLLADGSILQLGRDGRPTGLLNAHGQPIFALTPEGGARAKPTGNLFDDRRSVSLMLDALPFPVPEFTYYVADEAGARGLARVGVAAARSNGVKELLYRLDRAFPPAMELRAPTVEVAAPRPRM